MKHHKKPLLAGYGRYSGLAFQMGILIFLGTYGGIRLDEKLQISPLFTIIGSLSGIAIAIYVVIKDFIIKKK
ncbi:MAG TPA: AtpZ/AtpI family protein [Bacteroidales bacterium]|nr:AtpZ/AtpI family protein [Bacteroidales bacterium]